MTTPKSVPKQLKQTTQILTKRLTGEEEREEGRDGEKGRGSESERREIRKQRHEQRKRQADKLLFIFEPGKLLFEITTSYHAYLPC